MSVTKKTFLIWWIGGLLAFAAAIVLHNPLIIEAVPEGILDHQAAPDAAAVNTIHAAWKDAGVFEQARLAMFGDLVFIQIYAFGALLGGLYYARKSDFLVGSVGKLIVLAAVVFFLTDNAETISQLIQHSQDEGSDRLAMIASTCQGPKVVTFMTTFLGLIVALILERFRR